MALGTAKTDNFMIGTAAVLVGPQDKVLDLNFASHGLGMVKNFTLTSEPAYTELTQGVRNQLVSSVMTSNPVRATCEMYEYTPQNLKYALGLDGSTGTTAPTTESTVSGSPIVGDGVIVAVPVVSATGFAANDFIMIGYGTEGAILVRRISSIATNTLTLTKAIPTGVTLQVGATVKKVLDVGVGEVAEQPFLSAMIIGPRANGKEMVILLPKIRITKGFTLAYTSEQFGNMPFEMAVYDQVGTDPFATDPLFLNRKGALVLR